MTTKTEAKRFTDLHEEAIATGICRCGHSLHDAYRCAHHDDDGCPCDCACTYGSLEATLEG